MSIETLISDPGFQLNLLLWMARSQPSNAYITRPIFYELGFEMVYIENPFPLPEEVVKTANEAKIEFHANPEPDLLLRRDQDNKALYFEAKANSFSETSSSCRQACGHLLACGAAFPEVMAPLASCLLCYVVPNACEKLMRKTLKTLFESLKEFKYPPGTHSVNSLEHEGEQIFYHIDAAFCEYTGSKENERIVVMKGIREDTDPSPLFLVFSDDDYPDPQRQDLNRRAFQNQVHATLLCRLNQTRTNEIFSCSLVDLLDHTTDHIFQFIGSERQKRMKRLVRGNIFKRIENYWRERKPDLITFHDDILTVKFQGDLHREEFLDWLEDFRRTQFETGKPAEEENLPLLEMMEKNREL